MKNRKSRSFGKKIKYFLGNIVSKGFLAQVLLLAGTGLFLTLIFGIVTMRLGKSSYIDGYWATLMHMIDQGTITGDEKGSNAFFTFMLFVTIVGIVFTSTIIALISSGMQNKLGELNKGHSDTMEKNHVVILGFNENAFTICCEIVEGSYISGKRAHLVIADDLSKEEMEHTFKEFSESPRLLSEESEKNSKLIKKPKITFRSGDPISENTLSICAVQNADTIIINRENDLDTIRILLALVSFLKKYGLNLDYEKMPSVVTIIHDHENMSAAKAAAELISEDLSCPNNKCKYKIRIMYDKEMLGRLFSQSCLYQGLPFVMDGLFNYRGSSIHIEKEDASSTEKGNSPFIGKTLSEISSMVSHSIPLGFAGKSNDKLTDIILNPSDDSCYRNGDRLVYLSKKSDLVLERRKNINPIGTPAVSHSDTDNGRRNFLVIGWNEALSGMIKSGSIHFALGSTICLVSPGDDVTVSIDKTIFEIRTIHCDDVYHWNSIKAILDSNSFWFDSGDSRHLTNIVIPVDSNIEKVLADEKVMVLLLNIRKYLKDKGIMDIGITSEMNLPQNQMLVQNNSTNDFVVASGITNRLVAHIAEDPRKYYVLKELLNKNTGLIKMFPLSDYVDTSHDFNFEYIFQTAVNRKEEYGTVIPLGWIRAGQIIQNDCQMDDNPGLVLNPSDEELEQIHSGDIFDNYLLVVLNKPDC